MALSNDLISQFVKVTKDEPTEAKGSTVYGEVVKHNGKDYVKIDGSDLLTPVSSASIVVENGERVAILVKDHTATVTGNITSPAGTDKSVQNVGQKVTELYSVVAEKATFEQLEAEKARIDDLVADNVTIKEQLTADSADIADLKAKDVTIEGKLTAAEADIENLETKKLDASVADIKYATVENLEATNADVHNLNADYGEFKKATADDLTAKQASIEKLQTDKLDASEADIKYATVENLNATNADVHNLNADYGEFKQATVEDLTSQNADIEKLKTEKLDATNAAITYATIDFANINQAAVQKLFSDSGIIKDLVVSEGKITGELVGVTIKGDLIEGGTVVADKLVVKGENGLYYKLNTDGVTTEAEQTDYNSLNGQVITAKSITATKIAVDDLVAFGATIGGFNITDSAIYSGAKGGVDSNIQGIYFDKTGQVAIGDDSNFLKYYKGEDGNYKLEISASSVKFGVNGSDLEDSLAGIEKNANDAIVNSKTEITNAYTSLIEETSDQIRLMVNELSSSVDANSESITHISNSIDLTSQDINFVKTTMTNIQNAVDGKVSAEEIQEWARFDGATLELGASNQPFKARLSTTELAFYQGDNKVAWISNNELHILTAIIAQSIGCGNFTFVDEGSLGFSLI